MALQYYENQVIENSITDIVNSSLDVHSLLTVDNSLTTNAGLKKIVHKYTYSGAVEQLAKGAKNTDSTLGAVSMTSTEYTVNRYQHTFKYNDVDIMTDPYLMDVLTDGAGKTVANEIKQEYWNELAKISNKVSGDKLTYDLVVDAIASLGNVEDDTSNKFLCVGVDGRQQIRKDDDYINSHQGDILYSGQFGTVAGIPVIFSRLVPTGKAYITQKDAVKFFVKRQGTVEQDRDIETKDNTVVYERHGVMALVDDTRSVIVDFSGTAGA